VASNKRERELARMRAERQAARRAAAEAQRRQRRNALLIGTAMVAVVAVVVGIVLAVGLGGDDKTKSTTVSSTKFGNLGGEGTCKYEASGDSAKKLDEKLPPTTGVLTTGTTTATVKTNQGSLKLTLNAAKAPCTVNSFVFLAQQSYFDSTSCHRLTTSGIYVLQCGDPTGTGSGGPGYQFADENLTGATYPKGTLAMANAGAGTNGSQFFLVYKDTQLPASYTPFGTITSGLDVVAKVAAKGAEGGQGDGKPKLATTIESVTIS
jgi:peptidyl-prolyl cis-trans isomerase B (cyclophilin B)